MKLGAMQLWSTIYEIPNDVLKHFSMSVTNLLKLELDQGLWFLSYTWAFFPACYPWVCSLGSSAAAPHDASQFQHTASFTIASITWSRYSLCTHFVWKPWGKWFIRVKWYCKIGQGLFSGKNAFSKSYKWHSERRAMWRSFQWALLNGNHWMHATALNRSSLRTYM